jgi:hypothetical protein
LSDHFEDLGDVGVFVLDEVGFAHAKAGEDLERRADDASFIAGAVFDDDDAEFFKGSAGAWSEVKIGPFDDRLRGGFAGFIEVAEVVHFVEGAGAAAAGDEDIGFYLVDVVPVEVVHLAA